MTAVELLKSYSGESAEQFESCFQFSKRTRIIDVDVYAVGMESTTVRYSGLDEANKEVNNILRITTADGFEGISGVDSFHEGRFSDEVLRELQNVACELIAIQTLDPVEVGTLLERIRSHLSDMARSSIDIELWDLAARKAECPLYEMLGAKRNSMEYYASLPFYDSIHEYGDAVRRYGELGHTVFKFHVWGSIGNDLQLVEMLQQTFANSSYRFMVDLEEKYDLEDALRLGRAWALALTGAACLRLVSMSAQNLILASDCVCQKRVL